MVEPQAGRPAVAKDELRLWAKRPDAAAELVDVGWWIDDGDCYLIRHHACYEKSRDAVLHQQTVNRQNRRKGRDEAVP